MHRLLACGVVAAAVSVAAAPIPTSEKEALVDLFYATNGKQWVASKNWISDADPCDW